jgi:hypothetical protein
VWDSTVSTDINSVDSTCLRSALEHFHVKKCVLLTDIEPTEKTDIVHSQPSNPLDHAGLDNVYSDILCQKLKTYLKNMYKENNAS